MCVSQSSVPLIHFLYNRLYFRFVIFYADPFSNGTAGGMGSLSGAWADFSGSFEGSVAASAVLAESLKGECEKHE